MSSISNDLLVLLPEGLLALAADGALVDRGAFDEETRSAQSRRRAIVALAVRHGSSVSPVSASQNAFHGAFVADGFARFASCWCFLAPPHPLMSQNSSSAKK